MLQYLLHRFFPNVIFTVIIKDQPVDAANKVFHALFAILVNWIEIEKPFSPNGKFDIVSMIQHISTMNEIDNFDDECYSDFIELLTMYIWYKSKVWDISHCQFINVDCYANTEADITRFTSRLVALKDYLV